MAAWGQAILVSAGPAAALVEFDAAGLSRVMKQPVENDGKELRVVIAEGNGRFLEGIAERLASQGVAVRKVADPWEILPIVGSFKPHVLVLDDWFSRRQIGMEQILPELFSTYPTVRVVVTSGEEAPDSPRNQQVRTWGVSDVLDKSTVLAGDTLWRAVANAGRPGR